MSATNHVRIGKAVALACFLLILSLFSVIQARAAPAVNVTVEGQPLVMPVPPVIVQDRTLVGVRSVGEAVGGTVTWNQERRQATVTRGSDSVVLTIGKREAMVNGRSTLMEVPAQLVQERTMVPLRFIAEALGCTVEWNQATRTVNIVRKPVAITGFSYVHGVDKTTVELRLSDQPLSIQPEATGSQVALNLYPASIAVSEATKLINDSLMKGVRLVANGRTVRLEADLQQPTGYRYSLSTDGTRLLLEFDHTVTGVQLSQDGRIPQVAIAATGALKYEAFQLQDPPRLVVDLPAAALAPGVPAVTDLNHPYVRRVRIAPRQQGGIRLVFDTATALPYDVVADADGLRLQFVPRIQAVRTEKLQGRTRLTFAGNLPMDATVTVAAGNKLLIQVPQGRSDLTEKTVKVADGTVNTISLAPGSAPNATLITVDLPYYLAHTVVSKNGDPNLIIDLVTSPVYGKRIWIDAGHGKIPGGADDPGSIGRTYGTLEKVINLQVALQLQKQLQAAGATVFMTRTGDEGIDFRARPAVVNNTKPAIDLFISIHHNASTATSARGIETYYWTTNAKSRVLAERIQPAVVAALGFPDRKVRTDSFYVIKETKAPSVLVELGYLSNVEEERAIAEPGVAQKSYPQRAARGILNGIVDYYWQEIRISIAN
jgi:N-acetylmuramoyl-L-alanine amidase